MTESASPEIKKILFLDFDGPMVPLRAWSLTNRISFDKFDPIATSTVERLLERNPDIGLVISSSWRSIGKERIEEILSREGISPKYLHPDWDTKNLENHMMADRHTEILEWMGRHPEIELFVAVDDYPLKLSSENFVHVSSNDGMLWESQRQLFKKLKAKGCGF